MLPTKVSPSTLPRVTKLRRHRSANKCESTRLPKRRSRPIIKIHARIHSKDENKLVDHRSSGDATSHRLSTNRPLPAIAAVEASANKTDPVVSSEKSKDHRSNRDPSSIGHPVTTQRSNRPVSIGSLNGLVEQRKRRTNQRKIGGWCCPCSHLCVCLSLFGMMLGVVALAALLLGLLIKSNSTTSSPSSASTVKSPVFFVNLLTNGDGETGPCERGWNVTSPAGWNYNGTITQVYYNNSVGIDQSLTTPGPSDRGQCYFYGQASASTSMWQTISLEDYVPPTLIDSQTIKFNFSAWLGGYSSQDDCASASLSFANQAKQTTGSIVTLGPVLAVNRSNQTSLLFSQANGFVPLGARSLTVLVTITRAVGLYNNGDVDNVAVYLYQ